MFLVVLNLKLKLKQILYQYLKCKVYISLQTTAVLLSLIINMSKYLLK